MADISKLEQQANLLMRNVMGWENSTLQRIGKRIKKYGKLSLADVKSINNIATVKQDMDAITKELARVTGYNISQIEQMYGDLLTEQHLANQPLYDYRGKKFVPFAENKELQAIARAYAKTTGETMINLSKISAQNLGVVKNINGKNVFEPLQKFYADALDKAVMQVTSGATDFHTAMRETIQTLGGSGMSVNYGSGIHRRLDTAVRQSLLWGAKQTSIAYNEMIYDELGCTGYEVDWHSNPRPSHEFMQGKQFVVGKARTINGVHFDSFDEAEKRLQDYGCLHFKTPIICGVSEPRYSPEELKRLNEQNAKRYTIDGKEYSGYEVTQMQRRLESSVRNEKTTRDLAKASGDNALVKRCNERIKAYQGKYNEISEITGIQGDKKRMSVPRGTAMGNGSAQISKSKQNVKVIETRSFEKFFKREGASERIEALYSSDIGWFRGTRAYTHDLLDEVGYSGKPVGLSANDFEETIRKGQPRLYRGVDKSQYNEQLLHGDFFVGKGAYGHGTYTSTSISDARGYGKEIVSFTFSPEARVIEHSDLQKMLIEEISKMQETMESVSFEEMRRLSNLMQYYQSDITRYAVNQGYDVIKISGQGLMEDGSPSCFYNILNRTKIIYPR